MVPITANSPAMWAMKAPLPIFSQEASLPEAAMK